MARSMCTCGNVILWKANEPESDEWCLIAKPDMPDDWDGVFRASTGCAFCPKCGRLWVGWGQGEALSEYVPVDPEVRAVRPKLP